MTPRRYRWWFISVLAISGVLIVVLLATAVSRTLRQDSIWDGDILRRIVAEEFPTLACSELEHLWAQERYGSVEYSLAASPDCQQDWMVILEDRDDFRQSVAYQSRGAQNICWNRDPASHGPDEVNSVCFTNEQVLLEVSSS